MTTCPHCGQVVRYPHRMELTQTEMVLFTVLFDAFPGAVQVAECEVALYGGRHDGGPASSRSVTRVTKGSLDRKLRPKGWAIVGGRGSRVYRLAKRSGE